MSNLSKQDLRKLAFISPRVGDYITDVIDEMISRANTYNIRVTCVFNEAQFTVEPAMDAETAYQLWLSEMNHHGEQYRKSMKAAASHREQEARAADDEVRGQEVSAMLEEEGVQVPWYKRIAFNKAVRINSDPYGAATTNYAIAWAVAMQRAIRQGHTLEDVAEELSHHVDFEGITGFQYGCAVSFLANFWTHGEQLRKWHNLSTQIGNEGEEANSKKGFVLNPAILVIGKKG